MDTTGVWAVHARQADRRRSIGEDHARKVSHLHRIRLEMLHGGAENHLSAARAKVPLTGVRPRDAVGKMAMTLRLSDEDEG